MAMDPKRCVTMHVILIVFYLHLTVLSQIKTQSSKKTVLRTDEQTDIESSVQTDLDLITQEHFSTPTCIPSCETHPDAGKMSLGQTDSRTVMKPGQQTVNIDFWQTRDTDVTVVRRKRTIVGRYPVCPRGCTSCSAVNGCVTCERRYYIFLYRRNMRQIAMCTPSCPPGYFGIRSRHFSRCSRCQVAHCQTCFTRRYCTRCYPPRFSHHGACLDACPPGMHFANYSSECRETVDCLLGPWTPWSACTPRGRGCPQRRGVKVRSRSILDNPSPNGTACPELEERRGCQVPRAACRDNCRRRKRHKRKRKRGRGRKWRKSRKKGRGRIHNKKRTFAQRRRCRNGRGSSQRCRRRTRCTGTPG